MVRGSLPGRRVGREYIFQGRETACGEGGAEEKGELHGQGTVSE